MYAVKFPELEPIGRITKRPSWNSNWLWLACGVACPLCLALVVTRQVQIERALATAYLFADYIIVVAFVGALVLAAFLKRLRSGLIGVATGIALVSLIPILSNAIGNQGPKSAGTSLKVITFNWLDADRDYSDVYQWVHRQNPDILVLNEFNPKARGVTERLYPQFAYRSQTDGDILVLSKYPMSNEYGFGLPGHYLVRVDLNIGGKRLRVYGAHAPTLRTNPELAERNDYLVKTAFTLELDATDLSLMMGDFNATRWDPHFARILSRGKMHEEPRFIPLASRMGVRSNLAFIGAPIDHIMGTAAIQLKDCKTGPSLGSDHLPIICHARI